MNSGNTKGAVLEKTSTQRQATLHSSPGAHSGSRLKSIVQRSRLTEQDLEQFQQSIIEAHKRKNYRVLIVATIIFTFVGSLIIYFIS